MAILPSASMQRQQAGERVGQVRRQQELQKNVGLHGKDIFEHQVESADAVAAVSDDAGNSGSGGQSGGEKKKPDAESGRPDNNPTLDINA